MQTQRDVEIHFNADLAKQFPLCYMLNGKGYVKYGEMFVERNNPLDAFQIMFTSFFGVSLNYPALTGETLLIIQRVLYGVTNTKYDPKHLNLYVLNLIKDLCK